MGAVAGVFFARRHRQRFNPTIFKSTAETCFSEWDFFAGSQVFLLRLGPSGRINSSYAMNLLDQSRLVGVGYLYSSQEKIHARSLVSGGLTSQNIVGYEGEFALATATADFSKCSIVTDRFASRPMYLFVNDGAYIFSTDMAFLYSLVVNLGFSVEFDRGAVFETFRFGHSLDWKCGFKNFYRMPPACIGVFDTAEEKFTQSAYWHLEYKNVFNIDPAQHADDTYAALKSSTAKRFEIFDKNDFFLALSGGLDSRIVASTVPSGVRATALTVGEDDEKDVVIARLVAKSLEMDHYDRSILDSPLHENIAYIFRLCFGQTTILGSATSLPVISLIKELGVTSSTALFGGWPGDVLAGGYIRSQSIYFEESLTRISIRDFANNYGTSWDDLSNIFNVRAKDLYDESSQNLFDEISSQSGFSGAHKITAWAQMVRQPGFSFISPSHQMDDIIEVTPHLGYSYVEKMLLLPSNYLREKSFYKFMLYRCDQRLRAIPYANTGELLNGSAPTLRTSLTARGKINETARSCSRYAPYLFHLLRRMRTSRGSPYSDYLRPIVNNFASEIIESPVISDLINRDRLAAFLKRTQEFSTLTASEVTILIHLLAISMQSKPPALTK